jgi:hypothetical protein
VTDLQSQFEQDGVLVHENALSNEVIADMRAHFDLAGCHRAGSRGLDLPQFVLELASPRGSVGLLASRYAGGFVKPVRVLFFDKTPHANWAVPWHQDRAIAVKERFPVEGYGSWTVKSGVIHVEPPVAVLEGMLTLRVFIVDCPEDNGPLEVAVGSHRNGRVPARNVVEIARRSSIFVATGRAGDVLIMKTLAIHRSKRAISPEHRRVLHVDYASFDLPAPLEWVLAGVCA